MMVSNVKFIINFILSTAVVSACTTVYRKDIPFPPSPPRFQDLSKKIVSVSQTNPLVFLQPGPYAVASFEDIKIPLRPENLISVDIYLPAHIEKAPLILIQHGNNSTKAAHRFQAKHLASWGFNAVTVGQVKRNQWIQNGKNLRDLVTLITKWPALIDESCDLNKIILVGHSFGGSAISIAASNNPNIRGLVLLDPALYNSHVTGVLSTISAPVILLGADKKIFLSKQRAKFFDKIPSITEMSLVGTTHDDAQMPSQREIDYLFDPSISDQNQKIFTALLSYAAFHLSYAANPLNLLAKVNPANFLKDIRIKNHAVAPMFSQWSPPDVNLWEPGRD